MGKEEIAHSEQFLFFPVFSTSFENLLPLLTHSHTYLHYSAFETLREKEK